MRVIDYTPNSIVDGTGVRQVFWLAGCPHHCEGCHNPQTWNPDAGEEMSQLAVYNKALKSPYDVTFSGGDPMYQSASMYMLLKHLHKHKNIWMYTGYTWEEIMKDPFKSVLLPYIDVLVDGRFIKELADPTLKFRGSSNQRIIDVQKSLANKKIVLMEV